MEKLIIKNFAGFREVELEIRPITGFIGPEASGKSVIAKLLYFFRQIAANLPIAVVNSMEASKYKADCLTQFGRFFPIEDSGASDFSITYQVQKETVCVTSDSTRGTGEASLKLDWSAFYDTVIEKFTPLGKQIAARPLILGDEEHYSRFESLFSVTINRHISDALGTCAKVNQLFIPAGRASFSQVQKTIFTLLESGDKIDSFMVSFGSLLERSKSSLDESGFFSAIDEKPLTDTKGINSLRESFAKILRADLQRIKKQDVLVFPDGRRVKLAQASSGQQESIPLLLVLARIFCLQRGQSQAVYIEEPEAHLFPSTQKLVVELMAQIFRARHEEMSIVLTTHSPYILTSLNNLLLAGKHYQNASEGEKNRLEKIIPSDRTLSPDDVAFYALKDGMATSILDREMGLINAEVIDEVSNDIAVEFDKILFEGNEKS